MVVGWLNIYPYNPLPQPANQPPFFELLIFIQPTIMVLFNDLWQIFLDRGALATQRAETANLWARYTPEQQQRIYDSIKRKYETHKFIHYNPRLAICENAPKKYNPTEPTNYNGARSLPDEPLVRAVYCDIGGLYTRAEAELYNMQILGDFKL